jgi:type I restriction enzyme S subunit
MLSKGVGTVLLGDAISGIEAGRSPDGLDRQPHDGEASVLKVSAVRPGWFDRTQVKVITDTSVFPEHALVRDGDLLITRANTRELVGSVCLVESPYPKSYLCDKTLRLVPNAAKVSREYLHEVLQSDEVRRQLSDAATGTSASMKNISQSAIRRLRVPLLSEPERTGLVKVTSSLRDATLRAEVLVAALVKSRASVVAALLGGDLVLPESYDHFLDPAA